MCPGLARASLHHSLLTWTAALRAPRNILKRSTARSRDRSRLRPSLLSLPSFFLCRSFFFFFFYFSGRCRANSFSPRPRGRQERKALPGKHSTRELEIYDYNAPCPPPARFFFFFFSLFSRAAQGIEFLLFDRRALCSFAFFSSRGRG